jgi:hypothetical protein
MVFMFGVVLALSIYLLSNSFWKVIGLEDTEPKNALSILCWEDRSIIHVGDYLIKVVENVNYVLEIFESSFT